MERPAVIREEYLNCLDAFKSREGLANASVSGHSQLLLEFGLEPEMATMVTSFWMTRECDLSEAY